VKTLEAKIGHQVPLKQDGEQTVRAAVLASTEKGTMTREARKAVAYLRTSRRSRSAFFAWCDIAAARLAT
jgi:hypothetical protein